MRLVGLAAVQLFGVLVVGGAGRVHRVLVIGGMAAYGVRQVR